QRGGAFTQHVTAYRSRAAGPGISAFAVLRKPWTIPTLYGNRLALFFGQDSSLGLLREGDTANTSAESQLRGTRAVHPFSDGRDAVYTFSGGDTVAVLHTSDRAITIVRVVVEPRPEQSESPVVVFRGEINLDAELHEVVRMRGQFLTLGRRGPQRQRLVVLPLTVTAHVDLESVLIGGRYWLPRYQRIERHVSVNGLAQGNSVFRIVSRFSQHHIVESRAGDVALSRDSMDAAMGAMGIADADPTLVRRLTVAPSARSAEPHPWALPLGGATASAQEDNLAEANGFTAARVSRVAWRAQRIADVVHFNRVEGWSTGVGVEARAGAWAPRLRFRANGAWAWTEQTARGRVEALYAAEGGQLSAGTRLGRTLDITNDFTAPHDSGGSLLAALAGTDPYDYVDRRSATLWLNRQLAPRLGALHVEIGVGDDRPAPARLTRGMWSGGEPLPPNRGVDAGTYARTAVIGDWNPSVTGSALVSGVGARLHYEAAVGQINWQRGSLRLVGREDAGPFAFGALIDAGAVTSANVPSQQLFEVGGEPSFPGFDYKEFAGDRAVATHWRALYQLPLLRSPLRFLGCTCLTGPAPAFAITLHGARLWSAGTTTTSSIARLGRAVDSMPAGPGAPSDGVPVSRPTDGWRGSMEVGVRLFGGAVTVGTARVLEPGAPWRASVSIGQQW
ncbi:MAG: hypothetical protein AB1762_20090, partial [Gemmatimonadota bacterium]